MGFLRATFDAVDGQYASLGAVYVSHPVPSKVEGEKMLIGLDTVPFETV